MDVSDSIRFDGMVDGLIETAIVVTVDGCNVRGGVKSKGFHKSKVELSENNFGEAHKPSR